MTELFHTTLTNTWQDATRHTPLRNRVTLILFDDGDYSIGKWNGYYWVGQKGQRFMDSSRDVIAFYHFDLPPKDTDDIE